MRLALTFLILTFGFYAHAFIPEFKTILSRTADNHGRGLYVVDMDVVFPASPEPLTVKEVWLIRDEANMRVTLEGQGPLKGVIQGTIVYENGQKHFLNNSFSLSQKRTPEEWAEPYFYFRYSKTFRSKLVALKIIPAQAARERPALLKGTSSYTPPPDLRLSRVGGVVNYAIGIPTPVGDHAFPGMWIEQDQFLVRKVRFPSEASVAADQYQHFELNLWLPKVRTINWGTTSVQMQLIDVRSFGKGSAEQNNLLSPRSLIGKALPLKIPDTEIISEFYRRFR